MLLALIGRLIKFGNDMHILKAAVFILITLGSLIFVTYYLLTWSVMSVVILLVIGGVFVGGSIWGYKAMYHEEE